MFVKDKGDTCIYCSLMTLLYAIRNEMIFSALG